MMISVSKALIDQETLIKFHELRKHNQKDSRFNIYDNNLQQFCLYGAKSSNKIDR